MRAVVPTLHRTQQRYVAALGGETFERLALPDGAEDFVVLRPGSKLSELRYAIALHRVAGLRFVGRSLEFLDPAGTPRLRVAPPFVILRDGTRHDVQMRLDGCDADRRPTPPWGREVVAPGSPECELTVSWDPVLAKSGAVLDPAWTATQDMAVGRLEHGAVLMDDGRVLVAGSNSGGGASAEIFDPKTGTWAMTSSASSSLYGSVGMRFGGSRFVFVAQTRAHVYDPATGLFAAADDLNPSRPWHAAAPLPDGSVLVTGGSTNTGYLDTAVKLDPSTLKWLPAGKMQVVRAKHTATALADGRVLVVGGAIFGTISKTAEIYDPGTGVWTATSGGTSSGHNWNTATRLSDGRVLVFGDTKSGGKATDIFDPKNGTWTPGAFATYTRYGHKAVALSDGSALVLGGYGHDNSTTLGSALNTTEAWSPGSGQWVVAAPMNHPRYLATATLLSDDGVTAKILVAGGSKAEKKAEVLQAKLRAQQCVLAFDCITGACVDGKCCDAKCDTPCTACTAALKGSGNDGECGVVAAGTDPDGDCDTEDTSTCGKTGECDAAGACALYPAGTECKEGVCWTDQTTFLDGWTYACDGAGSCDKETRDCCYDDNGQKVGYCQCDHGKCIFATGGAGAGGTATGGAGFGGFGNAGGTGGATASGAGGASSGCGCRVGPIPSSNSSSVMLLLAAWVLRTRRQRRGHQA